jgi:hypothetical protein
MMETKYGKLLTTDCIIVSKVSGRPMNSMRHLQTFGDGKFSIETLFIWEPKTLSDKPHLFTTFHSISVSSRRPMETPMTSTPMLSYPSVKKRRNT